VDGLSYAGRLGQVPPIPNVGRGMAAWYRGATAAGVNDAGLWASGPDAPGGSSPGRPNSDENGDWIAQLRREAE